VAICIAYRQNRDRAEIDTMEQLLPIKLPNHFYLPVRSFSSIAITFQRLREIRSLYNSKSQRPSTHQLRAYPSYISPISAAVFLMTYTTNHPLRMQNQTIDSSRLLYSATHSTPFPTPHKLSSHTSLPPPNLIYYPTLKLASTSTKPSPPPHANTTQCRNPHLNSIQIPYLPIHPSIHPSIIHHPSHPSHFALHTCVSTLCIHISHHITSHPAPTKGAPCSLSTLFPNIDLSPRRLAAA